MCVDRHKSSIIFGRPWVYHGLLSSRLMKYATIRSLHIRWWFNVRECFAFALTSLHDVCSEAGLFNGEALGLVITLLELNSSHIFRYA